METKVFRITELDALNYAGPTDLIELIPVPGGNPLFIEKWVLESLAYAIVEGEFIHLSGPTGAAKTSLIEALYLVPDNFAQLCRSLGYPVRPLKMYANEMSLYEALSEIYQRRALRDGCTIDEPSGLVTALERAVQEKGRAYPLLWLREIGRVHSSMVQGGLLNLMTRGDIILPDGRRLDGGGIAWIADSNYQAENDSTHTLVTFDDALRSRFTINLTLNYLSPEQEVIVLKHLMEKEKEWRFQNAI